MAIQRIERYGQFRPSPVDDSRARVMRELAGAAGSLSDTARFFGEKKAAEEAPEKAQAAVEKAIQTDPETGEVILPETDEKHALDVAERLRKAVEACDYPALQGEKKLKVTISAGVSTFPDDGTTVEELVKKADIALYACKDSGRNCAKRYSSKMKPEEDIKTPEKK